MVTKCEDNSGIRFDVSVWPSQKLEIGYAKHSDDGKGGCNVDLRGARLGLHVDSPKNESLTGLQIGLANRTGDVNGLNLGILFNDIGKAAGLNVGLLWNRDQGNTGVSAAIFSNTSVGENVGVQLALGATDAKALHGVQVSLLSNYATVINGGSQVNLFVNSAGHVYDSVQLAIYKNNAVRLDNSVQVAGISNYANGLIHAAQLALGLNSTDGIYPKSFQGAVMLNMSGFGRDTQLAFLTNAPTLKVPARAQCALFNF